MKKIIIYLLLFLLNSFDLVAGEHLETSSDTCVIAENGTALVKVITSVNSKQTVRTAADDLANYLGRISGAEFKVEDGSGVTGIAVGTIDDFPEITFKPRFNLNNPGEQQGFEIKTHKRGIYVIGATPLAVSYAVYYLLEQLGCRWFFPMKKWEVIPHQDSLSLAVYIRETPDYYSRRIWPGFGYWPEYRKSAARWNTTNRVGGYMLKTGHAYDTIIKRNETTFKKHTEYYGLLNGKRTSSKLCVSNPGLRQLVVDFALNKFSEDPKLDSFSVDPSDGGGWCECDECKKIGTPSTRAVLLANDVSQAVRQRFSGKRIGMYAYNMHSPPPDINVDQDVVVSVATSFIRGGFTLQQILNGWRKKGAVLGIREYYDVYVWSLNAPGRSRGADIDYLKTSIPDFYQSGARYLTAEAGDDWGPGGLGYYLAGKMMWCISDSIRLEKLKKDFLQKCFGQAAEIMKKYYELLNGNNSKPLCSDTLGRMYRLLRDARLVVADHHDILARLADLVLYTKYCELLFDFKSARGAARMAAFKALFDFSAEIKNSRMVHTKAIYRDQLKRCLNKNERQRAPGQADWSESRSFSAEEINDIIQIGIEKHKLLDFELVQFSDDLYPAPCLATGDAVTGTIGVRRGKRSYYTWVKESESPIFLEVCGGMIKSYRNRGNVKIRLYNIGGSSDTGTRETLVDEDLSVPPDGETYIAVLNPRQSGLHRIEINDGCDLTQVKLLNDLPQTFIMTLANAPNVKGDFYFYIPRGVRVLGFYCKARRGDIVDPDGTKVFSFNKVHGYKKITIPKGMDGKLWRICGFNGRLVLLTVPPSLSLKPSGLLLPKEIIEIDELDKK